MTGLPITIQLFGVSVYLSLVGGVFAFLSGLFVFWVETQRDGFDDERSLDIYFLATLLMLFYSRFVFSLGQEQPFSETIANTFSIWLPGYSLLGGLIGLFATIVLFSRYWNWSVFRMFDIFLISLSFAGFVLLLWLSLVYKSVLMVFVAVMLFVIYNLARIYRLTFRSGYVFSIGTLIIVFFTMFVDRSPESLIFGSLLFTISLVNLYFRERKNPMKSPYSKEFIKKMKNILLSKKTTLESEKKLLVEEDPYMQEGRDADNEYLDDVAEDIEKEISDLRLNRVTKSLNSVVKALERIRTGKYGISTKTGEPISKDRLEAFPEAETEVDESS